MILFSFIVILSTVLFVSGDSSETGEISSQNEYIVGGFKINIDRVPWQAAFEVFSQNVCGASIISKRWVLTAAHCSGSVITDISIRVGSADKNTGGVVHVVKRIIQHPQYTDRPNDYDFALLELTDDIQFNAKARAIPLPSADQSFADGRMCLVTGWGRTKSLNESADHLRGVFVPIYNQEKCKENFVGKTANTITDRMICAGYDKGEKDACQGDSGGPLIVFDGDSSNFSNPILIGVVSWGVGCADPNLPGVYSRVTSVRKWIADVAGF